MALKTITKKTFIGGRLCLPGEMVDIDARGQEVPAGDIAVGDMSVEQLETYLRQRKNGETLTAFSANVSDPQPNNTGALPMAIAPVAPSVANPTAPQGIPPETVQHQGGFVNPVSADAPGALAAVVGGENSGAPTPLSIPVQGAEDARVVGNVDALQTEAPDPILEGGDAVDPSDMTNAQLRAELDRRGIEYPSRANNAELRGLLR